MRPWDTRNERKDFEHYIEMAQETKIERERDWAQGLERKGLSA